MADEERARYYYAKALQELKEEDPETNWESVRAEQIVLNEGQMPQGLKFHKT